jgi:hypothetical protein
VTSHRDATTTVVIEATAATAATEAMEDDVGATEATVEVVIGRALTTAVVEADVMAAWAVAVAVDATGGRSHLRQLSRRSASPPRISRTLCLSWSKHAV